MSGVHDQQQDVDALLRGGDFVHHLAAKRGVRVVQSGRVDEHNLAALLRHDALDAVSCGLRLGCDDGDLLADQVIEQRRFAGIGAADNGNEASARAGFLWLGIFVLLLHGCRAPLIRCCDAQRFHFTV